MPVRCLVRPGSYFDSVVLMRIAAELGARPGVRTASLVMATASNKDVLEAAGLLADEARAAGANDLVVAIDAAEDAAGDALDAAEEALSARSAPPAAGDGEPRRPRTLAEVDGANLAIVSTPGRYAAAEALKALRLGLSAFVFSDNVPIAQEVELKRAAHARGLIVMGPDCGTAIVGGVPLGFANEVRAGDIGLVGASGTGLQQVSSLIDRWGAGREPDARRRQPRSQRRGRRHLDARRHRRARGRPGDARPRTRVEAAGPGGRRARARARGGERQAGRGGVPRSRPGRRRPTA